MNEPEEFTSLKGATIPRKISVDYISFSAHVDYSQNSEFIELVKAQHVVRPPSFQCVFHITRLAGAGTWRTNSYGSFTRGYDISIQREG
jgi:cleavage and polyadenylation specificity factor subunit 3